MLALQSSNPVLANEHLSSVLGEAEAAPQTATVNGVVNKTSLLVGAAAIAGTVAYSVTVSYPQAQWIFWIASGLIGLVLFFKMWRSASISPPVAFLYAAAQGAFLGSLSRGLETILDAYGISVAAGALALQAFIITAGVTLATLALYRLGVLRPTKLFTAVIMSLTAGIAVTYLIGLGLMLFGIQLPFLSIGSALQGGTPALIGLGLNVLILIVASLFLVIDFGQVEAAVESRAPRSMEWFLAFGLIVTLAWIYFEALKLAFRLAVLFGNRK